MGSRFLLKLSGEAFGSSQAPLDLPKLDELAQQIARARDDSLELAIVPGGGNFVRGAQLKALDRVVADQMGMLATVLNGLALRERLERLNIPTLLQSAVSVAYADLLDVRRARHALTQKQIVIFAGGTGNPFVTTDTAAAIRASEIGAKLLLKATNVAGVYSDDPKKNPKAKLYAELTLDEAIEKRLNVMDLTALTLCREQGIAICVFDISEPTNLVKVLHGQRVGTLVRP
ncbi:MAG: UMP kinase [Candidatus Bipolaricaulota bacterium]|nr:UMP kinase [Candidatus Bipolaricaulota bacterium]MCS7274259.1 UMP kinase [Candidatus Bipolaricaulota bacterium]MDW8111043.1 UMP kinase [Candidatus Bipolaricaulota bacterium]MDW8329770.1 UMP kinase [Candidatus Bipolaricaulota bacterium]